MLLPTNALVELLLRADQSNTYFSIFTTVALQSPTSLTDLLDPPKAQVEPLPPNPPEPPSDDSEHAYYPLPVRPDDDVDEGYNELENPTANYPKPGQGLATLLPPEENDLKWLVDDNKEVYSHFIPAGRPSGVDDATMAGADEIVG